MALIVETGSASATANSYVSVEYADAYFSLYGNDAWPATPTVDDGTLALKQTSLIKATQALDSLYGCEYKSFPFTQDQALLFPRFAFYLNSRQICNSNTIPKDLMNAVCEVALIDINQGNIFPDVSELGVVKESLIKLDVLEKRTFYNDAVSNERLSGFYKIERLLRQILESDEDGEVYSMLGS